jgi:predicted polyphosphate/ATP-dependent NAD kinase
MLWGSGDGSCREIAASVEDDRVLGLSTGLRGSCGEATMEAAALVMSLG